MATICDGCLGDGCPCGYKEPPKPPPVRKQVTTYDKKINFNPFRKTETGERVSMFEVYYSKSTVHWVGDMMTCTTITSISEEDYVAVKLRGDA